jgi:hypothetical protein
MCDKRNGEGSGLAQNADAADTRAGDVEEDGEGEGERSREDKRIRDC